MPGRPQKDFHEYLIELSNAHVGHDDYFTDLAIAFLKYTIEAKRTVDPYIWKFPKRNMLKILPTAFNI
jgi:hypothetical protein